MSSSESELDPESYAVSMKRLQTTDPEFYEFLKENDEKLLNYQDSEEDKEAEESDHESGDDEDDEVAQLPSNELENLTEELQNSPKLQTCKKVMSLLKTCISRSQSSEDQLTIVDESLFNNIMKLCMVELLPALRKVLKLSTQGETNSSVDPSKSKLWKNISTSIKSYLIDMLKIVSCVSESTTQVLVLKHITRLIPYYVQFVKLSRNLIKKMIHVWSTGIEKGRTLAFVAIFRVMKRLPEEYHSQILKQMYFAYVRNTKFNTPSSLPLISFMKRSLTELYAFRAETAYEHAFLYLRQLCIHLRNAVTTKKKECYQTVYNWQFVNCIILWEEVITRLYNFEPMKTLVYPFVQLTIGTLNLIPTLKYVPLRFHLIKVLIELSVATKVFIPIPPLILEALFLMDTQKKATFSKKPMNFLYALRASKSQLQESDFRDTTVQMVCTLLTEYFTAYASSISFPELSFLAIIQIKSFLKKNKIAKYGQQLKLVLDKLQQNSNYVSQQRNLVSFEITDVEKVKQWENNLLRQGTPLTKEGNKVLDMSTEPPKKKQKLK